MNSLSKWVLPTTLLIVVLLIAILVVSLLPPRQTAAIGQQPTATDDAGAPKTISVSGTGNVAVKPDIANIEVGVNTFNTDAKKAQSDNAAVMQAVTAAVIEAGVKEADIQTSTYSVYPEYDYNDGKNPRITGYRVINMISVKVRDVEAAGTVLQAAWDKGANQSNGINFSMDKQSELYRKALEKAIDDAKAKAETIAAKSGGKLSDVLSIVEGSTPVTYYNSNRSFAAEAAMDTGAAISVGQLEITATVSVVYEIK